MDRDDIEGAIAAAEYFLALYGYIFTTGDLEAWQDFSHADCQFCRGAADRVTELYDAGGYAVGGEFRVDETIAHEPDADGEPYLVGLMGVEAPSQEYSESGEQTMSIRGGPVQYNFAIRHGEDGWKIIDGGLQEGDG